MTYTDGRKDRAWKRISAKVRARQDDCWICGKPIDYTLPATHRMSFTVDHTAPRDEQGRLVSHLEVLEAAHRSCNTRRWRQQQANRQVVIVSWKTSRKW
jgi:5-methylcytosine-specific restriction endonuclease McrA